MKKIKELFVKYKEVITYLIFGVLTTVVNIVSYDLLQSINGGMSYLVNNAIAWFVSVVFAYVTNKLFVFNSKRWECKLVCKEILEFFGARIFSFGIEELGLWLMVDLLGMGAITLNLLSFSFTGDIIAKVILSVIVIILNYFFSKFIIFKKKDK